MGSQPLMFCCLSASCAAEVQQQEEKQSFEGRALPLGPEPHFTFSVLCPGALLQVPEAPLQNRLSGNSPQEAPGKEIGARTSPRSLLRTKP